MKSDFDILIKPGNVGFYQSCEVTELFLIQNGQLLPVNFFTIVSFEERPFISKNDTYLTPQLLKVDKNYKLGIKRYCLTISEATEAFNNLQAGLEWKVGGGSLQLGKMASLPKQFISGNQRRLSHALKNNFHDGCYILEFFDEAKALTEFILSMKNVKLLNKISEEIRKYVPIDLSVVRDRIGNIIFQFPITVLSVDHRALSTWDGVHVTFEWHKDQKTKPNCIIQVEAVLEHNLMGGAIVNYSKTATQTIALGNLDQITHLKVWRKSPNLLLHSFEGSFVRDFHTGIHVVNPEPRIFSFDGKVEQVAISSGAKERAGNPRYTTFVNNVLYETEKLTLEKNLSFKQYFTGSEAEAFEDIRKLIERRDKNGVYLWDPFLRATDILQTLFYSPTALVPLKAIGSVDSTTKLIYKKRAISAKTIVAQEKGLLDNPNHNNYQLKLEYRMQHTNYGWHFHDRFLIFPGSNAARPIVYSLGTSVNALGKRHHILQEISHPQRVVDAFEELWALLDHPDCLVWKSK